jgi:Fe-S cluster assembly protein SufD
MIDVMETTNGYVAGFQAFEKALPAFEPAWLIERRRAAISRFASAGFPTTRQEAWKYTNLAPIAKVPFRPAGLDGASGITREALRRIEPLAVEAHRVVFVNGRFVPGLSEIGTPRAGMTIGTLADLREHAPERLRERFGTLAEDGGNGFVALNTAFATDGAFIHLQKNTESERPTHLIFVSAPSPEPSVSSPRNLIVAEEGSRASVIETYVSLSDGVHLTNAVTEVHCHANAGIEHYRLQKEGERAFHIGTAYVHQMPSSRYVGHAFSVGGAIGRSETQVVLDGDGVECTLNGLFMGRGDQLLDNLTRVVHAGTHGTLRELYKGILDGHSRGVFNGLILVQPGAQKTDAIQSNHNLLLSDDAIANSRPQLEIYADDVRCTHGSTTGQLDAQQIFYLRSRGFSLESAKALLTYAFAQEVVEQMTLPPLRAQLASDVLGRLPQGERIREAL